jgi:hypothetical protein
VTWIQRFSSSLALNVHFHALVLDGVYIVDPTTGKPRFVALAAPTHVAMLDVVRRVQKRVTDMLQMRGLYEDGAPDDFADTEPLLAACRLRRYRDVPRSVCPLKDCARLTL